jgi:hypothetical protein
VHMVRHRVPFHQLHSRLVTQLPGGSGDSGRLIRRKAATHSD